MKNTKLLSLLLIAVAVVVSFSLFACDNMFATKNEESGSGVEESVPGTNETTALKVDETTEPKVNETTEPKVNETTEPKAEETTEPKAEETTEPKVNETTEPKVEETTEPKVEETTSTKVDETTEAPACVHEEEVVAGIAATCEKTGLTEGKKCTACGETLVEQQVIPAIGHAWNEGEVTLAPDCENKGVKTYTCANDESHTKTEEIPAIGHAWNEGEVTLAPDCENKGSKLYTCANDATHTKTEEIPAIGHAWGEGEVTLAPECKTDGVMTYTCANDASHTKTEVITAPGHSYEWKYISNKGTAYEGTRYAVEAKICAVCEKQIEVRPAIIAFNIDTITAADVTGANLTLGAIGTGDGEMVSDITARVTDHEAIYLRNNQFIVAAGWVGIHGDFDTANGYYRILDANGEPLTDWIEKVISNTEEKAEDTGSYNSIKRQLGAFGVTDFVARGFKTNNLNVIIDGVDYSKYNESISIEYALRSTSAPEGEDLITLIVFKNVYKVCDHKVSGWHYVSNEGTKYEGTRYAVEEGSCGCGQVTEVRPAIIAFNIDGITADDSTGADVTLGAIGTGDGQMVTDPAARVTNQEAIYLRNNQFIVAAGWVGINGDFDTANAYYRILDENGEPLTDWIEKVISNTEEKAEGVGSYNSIKRQLGAHGVTSFVARGFKTNNLNVVIDGVDHAKYDKPISIEYALRSTSAPEGDDLVTVIVFKNVYKACTSHSCSNWQYVSGEGTEFEGTGYAVQGGTCDNCGEYVTRAAVVAYNFDRILVDDSTGADIEIKGIGTGGGVMVTDHDARITTQDAIYLRNNQFVVGYGWIGIAGDIDFSVDADGKHYAYYRILNNETGEALTEWQKKIMYDSDSTVAPVAKPNTAGSYTSISNQLSAQGITDFCAYGFRTNNLVTKIGGVEYASTTTPIAIEYAVKVAGAPEGYDLIRVIVIQNVYMAG